MDYNLENYGYFETVENSAVIAASAAWLVGLDKDTLKRQKYYNTLLVQNRNANCIIQIQINSDVISKFIKINPASSLMIDELSIENIKIKNMDTINEIAAEEISVTVQKSLDRLAYLLLMKKNCEGDY